MIRPIRHQNETLEVFSEEVKKRTCIRVEEENYACNRSVSDRLASQTGMFVCVHKYKYICNMHKHHCAFSVCLCLHTYAQMCVSDGPDMNWPTEYL